ncbi:unnamed protein product [Calicophoron daubneyi]|uniref:LIM zinc-binding domain-containing protein n=1 Tax=Calicophoron daubneyi TaxID=300641 RepID=A0AAV2TNT3_CALDB
MMESITAENKFQYRTLSGSQNPGSHLDNTVLETMFGKQFSRLTIEEEYLYNLTYLASQNKDLKCPAVVTEMPSYLGASSDCSSKLIHGFGSYKSRQIKNSKKNDQCDGNNRAETIELRPKIFPGEIERSFDSREANIPEERPTKLLQRAMSSSTSQPSESLSRGFRQTVVAAEQPSESPYPGLHIYVTETPPRPFYDVSSVRAVSSQPPLGGAESDLKCLSSFSDTKGKTATKDLDRSERKRTPPVRHHGGLQTTVNGESSRSFRMSKTQSHNSDCQLLGSHRFADVKVTKNADKLARSHLQRSATFENNGDCSVICDMELCSTCGQRVYPLDRVSTGNRVYHKQCFRCATCQRILMPANYASLDGIVFCKTHYLEQFRLSSRHELKNVLKDI